jgi:hypothetical protein
MISVLKVTNVLPEEAVLWPSALGTFDGHVYMMIEDIHGVALEPVKDDV